MLGAARRSSIVLLDFLAPSLIFRSFNTRLIHNNTGLQLHSPAFKKHITRSSGHATTPQVDVFNRIVLKLVRALQRGDTEEVINLWQALHQSKLLHFVNANALENISALLAKRFSTATFDTTDVVAAEDIALFTAARRSTDALNACLLAHLRQNKPEAVIELYQRFVKMLRDEDVWDTPAYEEVEKELPLNASLAADENNPSGRSVPHIPGHVNILLAVTAAHAIQDSFEEAFRTYSHTVVRFNDSATKTFLKYFKHDPEFQHKLGLYIRRLDVARLVARPPSLSKQITNLAAASTTKPLENLYQSIIDGLSGPDAYLAPDPSEISSKRLVAMTEVGWTSFLAAFLKCRRRDLASKIRTHMTQFGLNPGVSMYTSLIDAYGNLHAVDDALGAWNTMVAHGIKPDGLTYRAIISALFNGHRPNDALQTFRMFQEKDMTHFLSHQTLSVFNTVLHGLLSFDRDQEAKILLQNMESNGPKPDVISYNTFLAYYGRRVDFKALAGVVSQMDSQGVVGDVFSFSTILSALLKAGREDAPDIIFAIMRKQGIQPNVATYSTIIDHQMREQDERSFRAALRMLQQMEQDPSILPNEITYTSILAGLYRGRWLSADKAREWRNEILMRMKKNGVEFHPRTYHILIKASLEYPHPEGLEEALSYYHEMGRRNIPYVHTTWYTLLTGLVERGEWEVAEEVIKDMYISGARPRGGVVKLIGKIRRRAGPEVRVGMDI